MTNLDHIKSMSETSLASFLSKMANDDPCYSCPGYGRCDEIHEKRREAKGLTEDEAPFLKDQCKVVIKMWLRSPKGQFVVDEKLMK